MQDAEAAERAPPRAGDVHMGANDPVTEDRASDGFSRLKWQWIEQVQDDPDVADCVDVALAIARFVNRKSGDAWPSQPTLAAKARCSVRVLQRKLRRLKEGEHLAIESGRGRHHANRLRPLINTTRVAHFRTEKYDAGGGSAPENTTNRVGKCDKSGEKIRRPRRTEHYEEHYEEDSPQTGELFAGDPPNSIKPPPGRQRTVPEDWPSADQRRHAAAEYTAQGRADLAAGIESIAAEARDHHLSKGSRFADWNAAWRNWCRREIRFRQSPLRRNGTASAGSQSAAEAVEKLRTEIHEGRHDAQFHHRR